ncbi:MAG TPA: hypothetical protein VJL08_02020, partial [Dehalococcoidia bacterium]|nr:hypothetical protein [Dehalococcoidia bacterium]
MSDALLNIDPSSNPVTVVPDTTASASRHAAPSVPSESGPEATRPAPVGDSRRITTSGDIEVSTYLEIAKEKTGEQPQPQQTDIPTEQEAVAIIDFGSQYSMLIARRVRECHVYCEILPHDVSKER